MNIRTPLPTNTPAIGTVDDRIIATMRLILASSALLIIVIDPSEPDRFVALTYAILSLYVAYSGALYIIAQRSTPLMNLIGAWSHWVDVCWYVLLIALGRGTSSIFFFGFFFAILVASFRSGFASGLRVVVISALFFTTVGLATSPGGPDFELDRFLLRPIYLVVLGYMMAYWGGFEITLKRRLALLKEITVLSNPRFGVDRTIGSLLERLRAFYDADLALLVTIDSSSGAYYLRRTDRHNPEQAARAEPIAPDLAQRLLALPAELAVVYKGRPRGWWRSGPVLQAYDVVTGERVAEGRMEARFANAAIEAILDAEMFVSVPLRDRNETSGRIYLARQRRAFDESDADFLLQAFEHVMPVIDNIRLVDRLASDAADVERQRIAHDIHDSVIQPYVGLQIGLTAVYQKLVTGDTKVAGDVAQLIERSSEEIAGLRGYMRGLKAGGAREDGLLPALRRFAGKFAAATGIAVQVEAADDLIVNDRLSAEVFQMVAEGLSNIGRHTQAVHATIVLARRGDNLIVRIEDEGTNGRAPAPFIPRSITERAKILGGRTHVEQREDGGSAIVVEIPL